MLTNKKLVRLLVSGFFARITKRCKGQNRATHISSLGYLWYRGNVRRFEQQDRTAVDRNGKFDLNFRRIRLICALCSSYISLQAFIVAEWLARWTHDRKHRAQRSLIRLKFQLNLLFRWTVVRSCCSKRRTWLRCLSSDHDMSINWNFSRIRLLCALSGRLRFFYKLPLISPGLTILRKGF